MADVAHSHWTLEFGNASNSGLSTCSSQFGSEVGPSLQWAVQNEEPRVVPPQRTDSPKPSAKPKPISKSKATGPPLEDGKRGNQHCPRCEAHLKRVGREDEKPLLAGHKNVCFYLPCTCIDCHTLMEKRPVTCTQIFMKRVKAADKKNKVSHPDEYYNKLSYKKLKERKKHAHKVQLDAIKDEYYKPGGTKELYEKIKRKRASMSDPQNMNFNGYYELLIDAAQKKGFQFWEVVDMLERSTKYMKEIVKSDEKMKEESDEERVEFDELELSCATPKC